MCVCVWAERVCARIRLCVHVHVLDTVFAALLIVSMANSANAKGSRDAEALGEGISSSFLPANQEEGLSQGSALPPLAVMADDIIY